MAILRSVLLAVLVCCASASTMRMDSAAEEKVTKSLVLNAINNANGCPAENSEIPMLLPHLTDCGKFYICDGGEAIPKSCQSGLHFNPRVNSCDYPKNAECDTEATTSPRGKIINENGCPAENFETPVLLPHPTDCGKFYICDGGEAIPKLCQPGLHFNPKVNSCDYPENAKCDTTATKSPRIKVINENGCPAENSGTPEFLPHPSDCGKFYICNNGNAIPKTCPLGLHFNTKTRTCDYPEKAGCDSVFTKSPGVKVLNKNGCPSENSGTPVLLPHPTDCGKFYICNGEEAIPKNCQTGLHFNPKVNSCDYPENAKCDTSVTKSPRGNVINENGCPAENSGTLVLLPHPKDCKKFFVCDDGVAHPKTCPLGLHFNSKIQACDYPENSQCGASVSKSPRENNVIENGCPAEKAGRPVLIPDPSDCKKFFICDGGVAYPMSCHSNLYFNIKTQTCDYAGNVECGAGVSEEPIMKVRIEHPLVSCPSRKSVLLPHPHDCQKYFTCEEGIAHPGKCPDGLHFNRRSQECDYPSKALCEKQQSPRSKGIPSPFCPSVNGKTPVFYRHPSNCSTYYMCSFGLAYEFVCPAKLHFNLRKKACDYEANARCQTVSEKGKELNYKGMQA